MKPYFLPCLTVTLTLALVACDDHKPSVDEDPLTLFGKAVGSREHELLGKIRSAPTPAERDQWISELEETPERVHPFYSRWLVICDVDPFQCWTDDGYDPSRSPIPRDIQLLAAASYGIEDIGNGGMLQFFENSTGAVAPEMVEWFERVNMPRAAWALKKAMATFGESYPRSREKRHEILEKRQAEAGLEDLEWDPFADWDPPFYDAVSSSETLEGPPRFVPVANRWLRNVCGIANLHVACPQVAGAQLEPKEPVLTP